MQIRFFALALLAALGGRAPAQEAVPASPAVQAQPAAPMPRAGTVRVRLQTGEGPILLELEAERAPATTANFLRYVDKKRLDNAVFYRATKVGTGFGLVQGGVRDPKLLFPPVAHEPTTKTGLSHVDGAISMARHAPGSATADFFITVGDLPSMDANPAQPGDNLGFAVFGRVVEGMEVVRKILGAPISPTEGEGVMRGQMLAAPVRIVAARRED